MSARNRQMFGVVVAVIAWVWLCDGLALAQAAAPLPRVQYEAHGACPPQDVFVERVRARLRLDAARVPADLALRVTLSARAAGTHGEVELTRGATKTRRSVDAARCEEVVEALALISALALSKDAQSQRARAPKRDKTASPRGTAPRAEAESQTTDAPSANAAASAATHSSRAQNGGNSREAGNAASSARAADRAAERSAGEVPVSDSRERERAETASRAGGNASDNARAADGASERRGGASDSRERERAAAVTSALGGDLSDARAVDAAAAAAPARDMRESEAALRAADTSDADAAAESGVDGLPMSAARLVAPEDSGAWRLGIAASFLTFTGLAPALQPGLQLQAAFGMGAFSLQLGGRFAFRDRLVSADGDAWFGFVGGVLRVCGSSGLGSSRVALSGCAVAEPGVFSTGAENTENPRRHSRPWLALGAAADASFRIASWLSLRAGAELLGPLRRDRMSLAGYTLYRIPVLGLRLQVGVEVPFG